MNAMVVGAGMTRFTKSPERTVESLGREAVLGALGEAGVQRDEVEAAWCGTMLAGAGAGQRVLATVGMTGIPIVNVENACASGATALAGAVTAIRAGECEVALVLGIESLSGRGGGLLEPDRSDYLWQSGLTLPAVYAGMIRRHMALYGSTAEQLAQIAVKSHRNALANPYAHFHSPVTVAEVLASPRVADPITLYMCCPNTDGGAAVVVMSAAAARRRGLAGAWVAASVLRSGRPVTHAGDGGPEDLMKRAASAAYEQAGIGPGDLDVAEVHDAFAPGELIAYEALGLCAEGEGGLYVDSGCADIGGEGVAVNPDGGVLSRGHPLGATGVAQVAEVFWQLSGRAGDRQVEGAKVGIAHVMGGTLFELEASACAVHVLVKEGDR